MELIDHELHHTWHPCSQMKDYETFPPLQIAHTKGSYLFLQDNSPIIDAISSWWCKSLGHGHPRLKRALLQQLEKFEHVLLANTTNETIVKLSQQLAALTKTLDKIFYAGDGSCAVEIAMKMSLHAQILQGHPKKTKFIALQNGYHGETVGALSVSDLGLYRNPYKSMLFDTEFIKNIPYVTNRQDPLWHDCSQEWKKIEDQLHPLTKTTCAIILEPIIQGAGGMRIYSADFLKRLKEWAEAHNIYLIADEIMTGIGRTGLPLACQHANIEPDFLCLSKGLTSGWLPLSVVCTSTEIYNLFYDDYETGKAFLHSHTYSGNALAASIANEVLAIFAETNLYHTVQTTLEPTLSNLMHEVSAATGCLENIRSLGGVVAADLKPLNNHPRIGYEIYQAAVKRGALLRPLGNTLYWLVPLNTERKTLLKLQQITLDAITSVYF